MPKRLLIAAGEAADSADALPFGVRELIDTSDEVLVVTPTLPTRFEWLASATDNAGERNRRSRRSTPCVRGCPRRIPRRPHSRRAAPSGPRRLAGTRIARRVASPVWNSSHRLLAARVAVWTRRNSRAGRSGRSSFARIAEARHDLRDACPSSNWGVSLHHQRARCPGEAVLARRHCVADEDIEHAVTNAKGLTRRRRSSTSRSLRSDPRQDGRVRYEVGLQVTARRPRTTPRPLTSTT